MTETDGRSTVQPTEWTALTERTLAEVKTCAPIYRPTNFWDFGLDKILRDMDTLGLARFKSWPTSMEWFYPRYGDGFHNASIGLAWEAAVQANPKARKNWFASALNGAFEARRDFDVAALAWNQERWPTSVDDFGESSIGTPPQAYGLSQTPGVKFGRPYLNYLIVLAALSNHVDTPPKSFLEIGGGFGVLGEIVMTRDPEARYVDVDIPPLVTVSSYYLSELFGRDRFQVYDDSIAATGPIELKQSAVIPSWRLEDVEAEFDVFVNSFSFQEMEPEVVDNYIDKVCAMGVTYAVSLNSKLGTDRAAKAGEWGSLEPVTSAHIIDAFEKNGYSLVGQYGAPLVHGGRQLNVLKRN
jgi:putative sugar O-methyltransferase